MYLVCEFDSLQIVKISPSKSLEYNLNSPQCYPLEGVVQNVLFIETPPFFTKKLNTKRNDFTPSIAILTSLLIISNTIQIDKLLTSMTYHKFFKRYTILCFLFFSRTINIWWIFSFPVPYIWIISNPTFEPFYC